MNVFSKLQFTKLLTITLIIATIWLPISATNDMTLNVTLGQQLTINGQPATTTDVNGTNTQIFNYDGTIYAPIRGVAEALGQTVSWHSESQTVNIGFEGNSFDNDASYLQEYFGIERLAGEIDLMSFNRALNKIGVMSLDEQRPLTVAVAAKAIVAAADMTELASTYKPSEALARTTRYGKVMPDDAPYVATALDMGLIPNSLDINAKMTGEIAATLLMNAVEATGKGRNYIGFSSESDIAARLMTTWQSFILFDDDQLNALGRKIVMSGKTTGYGLKYDVNNVRFLTKNTLKYGHSDIKHAVQLMGLLNRSGLIAKVQLEPKVSVYQYLLEWNDGEVPAASSTYQVKKVADDFYLCYAIEYDLKLEFSNPDDLAAFDQLIKDYAKKSDDNTVGEGLIYGAWWQPLYSSKTVMPELAYSQINDVVVSHDDFSIHTFATNQQLVAVEEEIANSAPKLPYHAEKIWVNSAFYRYITGESHQ